MFLCSCSFGHKIFQCLFLFVWIVLIWFSAMCLVISTCFCSICSCFWIGHLVIWSQCCSFVCLDWQQFHWTTVIFVWLVFVSKDVCLCMLINRWGNLWLKGPPPSGNQWGGIFWGCWVMPVSSSCIWGCHKFISHIDAINPNWTVAISLKVISKERDGG